MAAPKCFCFMPIATVATCSAAQTNTHILTHTHVCAWHVELLGWLVLMRLEFCRVRLLWEKLKISSGPQVVSRICIKRMQPARKRGGRERGRQRARQRLHFHSAYHQAAHAVSLPPTALKASPQHTSTLTIRWAVSLCFSSASAASSLPAASSTASLPLLFLLVLPALLLGYGGDC